MTQFAMSDSTAAVLRRAIGSLPDEDRLVARAIADGRSLAEIARHIGVTEQEAATRVAAVTPLVARVAFARRCEVTPHAIGELVAVSPDLERGLYTVTYDHHASTRQGGSPSFAVMSLGGACVGLSFERPAGEWISVETAEAHPQ